MIESAGSLESSDCLITVKKINNNSNSIIIESIVIAQFGDQIFKVINDILISKNISGVEVLCQDKGALDYTIKARTLTALKRYEVKINE